MGRIIGDTCVKHLWYMGNQKIRYEEGSKEGKKKLGEKREEDDVFKTRKEQDKKNWQVPLEDLCQGLQGMVGSII